MLRVVALLAMTLLGGVAGLFAGGYGYNLSHPTQPRPREVGSGLPGLQAGFQAVGDAVDRHRERQNWIIGGALGGAGLAFVGAVLVDRVGHRAKPSLRPE